MESGFYRRGLWARDVVAISKNPDDLNDGNFWAVLITYEGEPTFAQFSSVEYDQEEAFFSYAEQNKQSKQSKQSNWNPPNNPWRSSLNQSEYLAAVREVRNAIERGDVYQINLCRILETEYSEANLLGLMGRLRRGNPAPYLTSLELPGISVASASPELLLRREGARITSSPIKGTAKERTGFLEKDRAENVMIVDLVRHDFGSICRTGSIQTPRLLDVEEHPGLFHLVSDVQGELAPNTSWQEIFTALLPAGSISGAPKSSAIELISQLEKQERGPYCGALGWIHGERAELAVGIRTFWRSDGLLRFGTGAGITWGSDPELEWAETELKAGRLLSLTAQ